MSAKVRKGPSKNIMRRSTQLSNRFRVDGSNLEGSVRPAALRGMDVLAGNSEVIQKVRRRVMQAATLDLPVLIRGEPGTSKATVARSIHDFSSRARGPFIEVWCDTADARKLLADPFTYNGGRLTLIARAGKCLFEQAESGTIFLKNVEKLPGDVQLKLHRLLQYRALYALPSRWNGRVITSTSVDIWEEIAMKRFNRSLFYELCSIPIDLPPLRERIEDLGTIVENCVDRINRVTGTNIRRLSPETVEALRRYWWPGNIDELYKVIERALVLEDGDQVTNSYLQSEVVKTLGQIVGIAYSGMLKEGETLKQHPDRPGFEIIRQVMAALERSSGGLFDQLGPSGMFRMQIAADQDERVRPSS